jgi:aryl-alcohol dehydrogenase-like predicted oxidoreductase
MLISRDRLPSLTERLVLGRSGLAVSPVCLGMVGAPEIVLAAFRAGINFFFVTADMHWPYYQPLRDGLRRLLATEPAVREKLVVAVVSYVTQPEFCHQPFEEVLEAIPELERIDLAVIGGSYPTDFFVRLHEYGRWRPGRMRALGATFHHRQSAVTAINRDLLDVAFIRYNPAHPGAELDVFPHLKADRTAKLFNFKSTSGYVGPRRLDELGVPADNWRPHPTDHYRFALRRPPMDGLLCGLDRIEHVSELERALGLAPLSEEEADYLKQVAGLGAGELVLES